MNDVANVVCACLDNPRQNTKKGNYEGKYIST